MFNLSNKVAEISVSYQPDLSVNPVIKSADDAHKHLLPFFSDDTIGLYERLVAGYFNRSNRLIGVYEVSKGGITSTIVEPRLILSVALKIAATGIILAHNHPSGNLQPSPQDKEQTKRLKEAAGLMEISLIDHLILSPGGTYYSMLEHGDL